MSTGRVRDAGASGVTTNGKPARKDEADENSLTHGLWAFVRCPGPSADDFQIDCYCGWKSEVTDWNAAKLELNCHLAEFMPCAQRRIAQGQQLSSPVDPDAERPSSVNADVSSPVPENKK